MIFTLVMIGCNPNEEINSNVHISENTNIKMAKLLTEAHKNIDPMKVPYYKNSIRADHYKGMMSKGNNVFEEMNIQSRYAYELLLSGKTELSLIELEKLLQVFESNNAPQNMTYNIRQLLGLAYMRLGEQQNCIRNNNEDSCIIPLQGEGVYALKNGPETAIGYFEDMLKERPDDNETIWLLNIAYMALGQYPEGVPGEWLIDESHFTDDIKVDPFVNISGLRTFSETKMSGGACLDDFDNDGLLDVICSSWGTSDQLSFFKNMGDGSFEDRTDKMGLDGITGGLNLLHADYDNDGFNDFFVLRGAWFGEQGMIPNSLIRNNGDGSFTDVTEESGLLSFNPSQTATWADFNLDGWLDLFIGNESTGGIKRKCELYLNERGKFRNVTDESGLGEISGLIKGVCGGDVDNDGYPEIYISMLRAPNILLKNESGSAVSGGLKFSDISQQADVQEPRESFPCWMWDYNNDGLLDLFAAPFNNVSLKAAAVMMDYFEGKTHESTQIAVYMNKGDGSFSNTAKEMNVLEPVFAMGANYIDINNDGNLDFYLGTGTPRYASLVPNKLYMNSSGSEFIDVSYSSRLSHIQKGHGVSVGDIDNDGDQDIFQVLGGAYEGDISKNAVFINTLENDNGFISIKLKGTTANRSAIGSRIKLTGKNTKGDKRVFYQTVSTGGSFGSSSLICEFGLGDIQRIDELIIDWPDASRSTQVFNDLEINSFIAITQGAQEIEYLNRQEINFNLDNKQ